MQLRKLVLLGAGVAVLVTGCATKTYGRLGPLTSFETASLTLRV